MELTILIVLPYIHPRLEACSAFRSGYLGPRTRSRLITVLRYGVWVSLMSRVVFEPTGLARPGLHICSWCFLWRHLQLKTEGRNLVGQPPFGREGSSVVLLRRQSPSWTWKAPLFASHAPSRRLCTLQKHPCTKETLGREPRDFPKSSQAASWCLSQLPISTSMSAGPLF